MIFAGLKKAFISLYVLQALAVVVLLCGTVIYQTQRIRDAQMYRIKALSDKSLIKAVIPSLLAFINAGENARLLAFFLQVNHSLFTKELRVELYKKEGQWVIYKVTALRGGNRTGCWAYIFLEKGDNEVALRYYGLQFGASL